MSFTVVAYGKNGRHETAGLAAWMLGWLRGLGVQGKGMQRQMKLLETLPLGGRRQLMLVACGGRRYLVGSGAESVTTIVCVDADAEANCVGDGSAGL